MPEGLSLSALARRLGRAKSGLHKLARAGQIPTLADGSFDEGEVRAALERNLDPARRSPVHRSPAGVNGERERSTRPAPVPPVSTEGDARAAVELIRRVLSEEGADSAGVIDFSMTRTAESILKVRERDLKIAERRKELVPLTAVKAHVGKAFIGYRQAIQRLPSRFAAQMAADVGCETTALDAALSRAIEMVLTELSAPVVRA